MWLHNFFLFLFFFCPAVIEVDLMVNDSTADFEVLEESPNAEVCVVVDSLPENGTLQCDVQVLVTTFLGTACKFSHDNICHTSEGENLSHLDMKNHFLFKAQLVHAYCHTYKTQSFYHFDEHT